MWRVVCATFSASTVDRSGVAWADVDAAVAVAVTVAVAVAAVVGCGCSDLGGLASADSLLVPFLLRGMMDVILDKLA